MWTCDPETHLFKQGNYWVTRSEYLNITVIDNCHAKVFYHVDFLARPEYAKPDKSQNATVAFPSIQRTALPHHRHCLLLVTGVCFACALP